MDDGGWSDEGDKEENDDNISIPSASTGVSFIVNGVSKAYVSFFVNGDFFLVYNMSSFHTHGYCICFITVMFLSHSL